MGNPESGEVKSSPRPKTSHARLQTWAKLKPNSHIIEIHGFLF
jgi:hypothetical protein